MILDLHFKDLWDQKKTSIKNVLSEVENNSSTISLEEIIKKKDVVFDKQITKYNQIIPFNYDNLLVFEETKLLETPVIGKNNSQVGELIEKLNNSDWVNLGRKYLKSSQSKCPFCQQEIDKSIIQEIEEYFDETYEQRCNEISIHKKDYENYINSKITEIEKIIENEIKLFNTIKLEDKLESIKEIFKLNLLKINNKISSPSSTVELESLIEHFTEVSQIIEEYRREISRNNTLVANLASEKNTLKAEMWKYIIVELQSDIDLITKKSEQYKKAKTGITKVITSKSQKVTELESDIKVIESTITSTEYTKNEINRILESFGYNGFRVENTPAKGEYKIVRPDGSDVNETLSEGEYTFITFLYFFSND